MACISKMAGYREKRSENWDSWTIVINIWGIFELVGFKVIYGSFGALVSRVLGCLKRHLEFLEWNGVKFGNQEH